MRPHARYDGATDGSQNRNHWAGADDLSANAAADPEVRRKLRRRSRLERDNGPSTNGLLRTVANETIGTGPRLQLDLGERFNDAARRVESLYRKWCKAVLLGRTLRVMRQARSVDGEVFATFGTDENLPHPVKLTVRSIEADQVETPTLSALRERDVSGIEFDANGNPAFYHILKKHPGDTGFWNFVSEFDRVAARHVLHWFQPTRPGQARGIPELAPSLEALAQLRRYDSAVLSSAEYAASISAVLESDNPAHDGDFDEPGSAADGHTEDWSEAPFSRNTVMKLPSGMKLNQLEAAQPTTQYKEFVTTKRGEVARPLGAPLNVATGDSSGYNYSSARMDDQTFRTGVDIDRDEVESLLLGRIFRAWMAEALLAGIIPPDLPDPDEWDVSWNWDAKPSLDPLKEASATEKRLALNVSTLAEECAAEGKDWEQVLRQRAKEQALAKALGLLPVAPAPAGGVRNTPPTLGEEDTADA